MKYIVTFALISVFFLSATSCRKNEKYYSCICSSKDTFIIERIGRMPKNTAYGSCKLIQDQYNVECQVEIRN